MLAVVAHQNGNIMIGGIPMEQLLLWTCLVAESELQLTQANLQVAHTKIKAFEESKKNLCYAHANLVN